MELRAEKPMLLKGDCLELMKTLPAKSVDLFLCDLPYGETNCSWDTKINMAEFWKEFKRIRRSKKTACIHFCSTGFGYSLIKSWEKGFKMDMVWKKRNKTGGLQSKYRPMRNHEMIYFFYEQAPKYNRDKYHKRIRNVVDTEATASVVDETDTHLYGETLGERQQRRRKKGSGGAYEHEPPNPGSVLEDKCFIGKRNHQTEKPQDILEFILKYWTDEGDVVLDPTMGSGSTGVACKKMGRSFIGIELTDKYYEVANQRINPELGKGCE